MSEAIPSVSALMMRVIRRCRWAAAVTCGALLAVVLPGLASAHSGVQSYLYIDVTERGLGGRVEMPYSDLREVLGLELAGSEEDILAELRERQDVIAEYVGSHFSIGDDAGNWEYEVTRISLLEAEGGYALAHFVVDVPYEDVPRVLNIRFDPFFDEIDDRSALLLIGNDWKGGIINNGENVLLGFDPETRTREVDLGSASQWNNFTASVGQGVTHIKSGPDHILFIAALLLPSVLVFAGRWHPATSFGSSLWRILKVVSMFTLAHSITFVLAGVEAIPLPPSKVVESVIALSIAVTALHSLRPVWPNREWLIAFVFGLFHGMGFASLVESLEVDRGTKLLSLLGRNVGIELGQAVVVIALFPLLFLLRRTRYFRPFFVVSSIVLIAVALAWMYERLFEQDLGITSVTNPMFVLPRAFIVVAALTAAVGVLFLVERRADRLLPTFDANAAGSPVPAVGDGDAIG